MTPPIPEWDVRPRESGLTQDYLRTRFEYNEATGLLVWKPKHERDPNAKHFNARFAGRPAGTVSKNLGYLMVGLDRGLYYAHRLAYLMANGSVPQYLAHRDGNKINNALVNLVPATAAGISHRARRQNKHGQRGVRLSGASKSKPFQAFVVDRGKKLYCGSFATAEEAGKAYEARAREMFGEMYTGECV